MQRIVVVHYGEIALKGENRIFFEKQLIRNIKRALPQGSFEAVERKRGRVIIHLTCDAGECDAEARLRRVFGIANFGFGVEVPKDLQAIKEVGWQLLREINFDTFKVEARRAQKDFPLNSMQINQEVGGYIHEKCRKRVDLTHPDATLFVEMTESSVYLYARRIQGIRGLPVGVSERAVCLLSSGIDSPVASYLMLKRGVNLIYAHFHSQPFTNPASQENTERIVQVLNQYQFTSKVYFIPFIDIQKEIMAKAPPELRVLLYRRYMVRLSARIAQMEKARALVTGENVAQVASQTLSNIRVVGEVTSLPILRPLAGFDKQEIVELAKRVGTYEISIAPYEDCCTLFVPDNPATKAHPKSLAEAERALVPASLLDDALSRAEIKTLECSEFVAQS